MDGITIAEQFDAAEPELPNELTLDCDIAFQAQRVSQLHLREPTAKQLATALREQGGGPDASIKFAISLISQVSRVPKEAIETLPITKLQEGARFFERFLKDGPGTGVT